MKNTKYYKPNGEIDKITTFINNHEWLFLTILIILFIACSIFENS